jgi:hypothetical protein
LGVLDGQILVLHGDQILARVRSGGPILIGDQNQIDLICGLILANQIDVQIPVNAIGKLIQNVLALDVVIGIRS